MSCLQTEILSDSSEIDQLRKEILLLRQENVRLEKDLFLARYDASTYKSRFDKSVLMREKLKYDHEKAIRELEKKHLAEVIQLQKTIEQLEAKVKLRERQLFGGKSERQGCKSEKGSSSSSGNKRGQQKGNPSPDKRDYSHLPVVDDEQVIPEEQSLCPCCNAPYEDINSTEDSSTLEIEVKAHIRKIRRKKYRRTCNCAATPTIITAPPVSKILSKSCIGNSVWIYFLLQKFWHGQPLHRAIQTLAAQGMSIAPGTLIGGFTRLLKLFRLVYQEIVKKGMSDKHWHGDETGWKVFESLEGKANNRWFLWVFRSESTAVFLLDPSRSAAVIEEHFGKESSGIISCDRYRAYFCFISKAEGRFQIAYCWAHVRRDFIAIAKDWPIYENWAMEWVQEIRHLYHINSLRLKEEGGSLGFINRQAVLEEAMLAFKKKADIQMKNPDLAEPCKKALTSLERHWQGLNTFVHHSEVPMDNNAAERSLRGGAVGRKNYYGSGSLESAEFTAIMFTIIQTLLLWNINPQQWFTDFFNFMGSNWKKEFQSWMPWNMSHEQKDKTAHSRHDPPPD